MKICFRFLYIDSYNLELNVYIGLTFLEETGIFEQG